MMQLGHIDLGWFGRLPKGDQRNFISSGVADSCVGDARRESPAIYLTIALYFRPPGCR